MKPREVCIRKSSDSCYILASHATDLPGPTRRWEERQAFSTTLGCSASETITRLLSDFLQRDRRKRQLQKNAHSLLFRSNDIPVFYPSVQRMVFYLLSFLFQFQEHLDLISNQSFRAATFSKPPSSSSCSRVQAASFTTAWGREALGTCSGKAQTKGGRTGRGLMYRRLCKAFWQQAVVSVVLQVSVAFTLAEVLPSAIEIQVSYGCFPIQHSWNSQHPWSGWRPHHGR